MKNGFIGRRNRGGPLAANPAAAGHSVARFDLAAPMPAAVRHAATAAEAAMGDHHVAQWRDPAFCRRSADPGRDQRRNDQRIDDIDEKAADQRHDDKGPVRRAMLLRHGGHIGDGGGG